MNRFSIKSISYIILCALFIIFTSPLFYQTAFGQVIIQGVWQLNFPSNFSSTATFTVPTNFSDGTSLLPSITFTNEPTLGIWRFSAGIIGIGNNANQTTIQAGSYNVVGSNTGLRSSSTGSKFVPSSTNNGWGYIQNNADTIGNLWKVDALPTIASGFGTSPAIVAGSTPFAGSVNVGTGGVATSGIINFNGVAFPSAPHCTCNDTLTTLVQRCLGSTTQLTITSAAWTASDIVDWICVSAK